MSKFVRVFLCCRARAFYLETAGLFGVHQMLVQICR